MADIDVTVNVSGLDKLLDRFHKLPDKLQKKGAVRAAREAMKSVQRTAQASARMFDDPASGERIWRNVAIQNATRTGRRIGGVAMRVGIRGGARRYANTSQNRRSRRVGQEYQGPVGDKSAPGGDTYYWWYLELGTQRAKAMAFLEPALSDNAQEVTDTLAMALWRELVLAEEVF